MSEQVRRRRLPGACNALALSSDTRGAILMMGVFMCACMVSLLWYFAGIGDAILYRERLQEAADATAFSAAALSARGMNLIVLLNLIMACILAVRVVMKALQAGLALAGAILLFVPGAQEMSVMCFNGAGRMQTLINATRNPINNTLKALSRAQNGIKFVVPGAAVAGAYEVGMKYAPRVRFAAAGSPFITAGLPVVEGSPERLCGEAAHSLEELIEFFVPDQAKGVFHSWVADRVNGAIKTVVEKGQFYFCELGLGSPPDFSSEIEGDAKSACAKEEEDAGAKAKAAGKSAPKFDQDKCVEDKKTQARRKMDEQSPPDEAGNAKSGGKKGASGGGKTSNAEGITPKKISPEFRNGQPRGQIISVTRGDDSVLRIAPIAVKIGAFRKQAPKSADPAASLAFAQAEFFYDCEGAWQNDDCDGKGSDDGNVMWHFRWRPRLRLFNAPFGRGQSGGAENFLEAITHAELLKNAVRVDALGSPPLGTAWGELMHAVGGDVILH